MDATSGLDRLWPTIAIPGIATTRSTYWALDLDAMPPIERVLDGSLDWLTATSAYEASTLAENEGTAATPATPDGLAVIVPGLPLPASFERFIRDPAPRRHVRSATACFLDLGEFAVSFRDGVLLHFLSDQQWVLHWLLWVRQDGSSAVLTTPAPIGFAIDADVPIREITATTDVDLAVCADSFEEFLYRYWAMNELFFSLGVERRPFESLSAELRTYANAYPRQPSSRDLFASVR
jgi:hypothetical protein